MSTPVSTNTKDVSLPKQTCCTLSNEFLQTKKALNTCQQLLSHRASKNRIDSCSSCLNLMSRVTKAILPAVTEPGQPAASNKGQKESWQDWQHGHLVQSCPEHLVLGSSNVQTAYPCTTQLTHHLAVQRSSYHTQPSLQASRGALPLAQHKTHMGE